jgi:hypothetical protein
VNPAELDEVVGFGPEEPGRHNDLFHLRVGGDGVTRGLPVECDEGRSDRVHPAVRTLRGQDHGYHQLERVLEVQLTARVGIKFCKLTIDSSSSTNQREACFLGVPGLSEVGAGTG